MRTKINNEPTDPLRAVGYRRVSTTEQGRSGLGLSAQQQTIEDACRQHGWALTETATDVASGRSLDKRPELQRLLGMLDNAEANVIVVAKMDRLSRSLYDAAGLLARAQRRGWAVCTVDIDLDTSSAAGRLTAHVLMSAAQFERELIGQRTREALAAARSRGVVLGRKPTVPTEVVERIVIERAAGLSFARIGKRLDDDGVPTGSGGQRWWPGTVKAVAESQWARAAVAR